MVLDAGTDSSRKETSGHLALGVPAPPHRTVTPVEGLMAAAGGWRHFEASRVGLAGQGTRHHGIGPIIRVYPRPLGQTGLEGGRPMTSLRWKESHPQIFVDVRGTWS